MGAGPVRRKVSWARSDKAAAGFGAYAEGQESGEAEDEGQDELHLKLSRVPRRRPNVVFGIADVCVIGGAHHTVCLPASSRCQARRVEDCWRRPVGWQRPGWGWGWGWSFSAFLAMNGCGLCALAVVLVLLRLHIAQRSLR